LLRIVTTFCFDSTQDTAASVIDGARFSTPLES